MRIDKRLLAIFTLLALAISVQLIAQNKFTIIIDPGHGGGDAGTLHRKCNMDEKTIALNVALKLGRLIESNYNDVKVVYTRKTDKYPTLPERTQIAKNNKGDLFISIHVNACPNSAGRGFETYVFGTEGSDSGKKRVEERLVEERENLDINGKQINFDTDIDIETKILCQAQREKHNKQSLEIANDVQSAIISGLKSSSYAANVNNRGVKAKNLFVLCYSPMPAILVELGYMSNVAEEKFINTDEAQSCFARSIYNGFRQYKSNWDKRQLNSRNNQATSADTKAEEKPVTPQESEPAPVAKPEKVAPKDEAASSAQSTASSAKENPASANTGNIEWRIQFLSSDQLLKDGAKEFKGLSPVTYYKVGKLYKYTYGSASTSAKLNQELRKVKKLFPDAFYVKFDSEGNRINN